MLSSNCSCIEDNTRTIMKVFTALRKAFRVHKRRERIVVTYNVKCGNKNGQRTIGNRPININIKSDVKATLKSNKEPIVVIVVNVVIVSDSKPELKVTVTNKVNGKVMDNVKVNIKVLNKTTTRD